MIISYGYAYPSKTVSFAGLTSGDNPYWVAYNQRADDDGAIPKDGEVNACAKSRFLSSIPNYTIFDFEQQYFVPFTQRVDTEGAVAADMNSYDCAFNRYYRMINDYTFFKFFNTSWNPYESRANLDGALGRDPNGLSCASTKMYNIVVKPIESLSNPPEELPYIPIELSPA